MNLLIGNFVFVLILGLFFQAYSRESKGRVNAFVVLSFISLFVIHAFVDPMSVNDLPYYKEAFEECSNLSFLQLKDSYWARGMEIGFLWYVKFLSLFSDDFLIVLIVSSLIFLFCYYRTILTYSPYTYVSVLLLLVTLFDQSIFVLRQHIAMAILTLSWNSIVKKDFCKFSFFIIIAFLFHRTSLVFIPLFFLYNIENNRNFIVCLLIVSVCLLLSYFVVLQYFVSFMDRDYSSYLNNPDTDMDSGTNYVSFILMSGLLVVMLYFMKSAVFDKGINRLLFSIISIAVVCSFLGVGHISTGRLFMYYTSIPYILVPNIMQYIKNQFIRVCFVISTVGIYLYISYFGSSSKFLSNITLLFM